jgi:hypothetical protein
MKDLNIESRIFNPWDAKWFVLCEDIIIGGMRLKFRDQVPTFTDLYHLHVHFYNGAIGTEVEMKSLVSPVELFLSDPINPIAKFVKSPEEAPTPLEADGDRGVFAIENAKLLMTKDDLIGYAAQFDIELKKSSAMSMKKMIEILEEEAVSKGLLTS